MYKSKNKPTKGGYIGAWEKGMENLFYHLFLVFLNSMKYSVSALT